jgi:hypothetical protein
MASAAVCRWLAKIEALMEWPQGMAMDRVQHHLTPYAHRVPDA